MSAKKKQTKKNTMTGHIEGAGIVREQPIVETLKTNYMPYAMSVIISRAIPEIDGFKPSHRKILYTMYKMGLLSGSRTKSANVVGSVMKLNPHGDNAIYETMVRLATGNEALLHGFVDSKGNFGKAYSRDMDYAASRYTEVKLESISSELFRDIDKNTVEFMENYDNTTTEPTLLPTTFPTILVNNNMGIAVGMASSICSFNLQEVCETTIALIKNPEHDVAETLKAPDFSGGAFIVHNQQELDKIYKTGRGSVKLRAKYRYDKSNNCIDITEIPASTTIEAITDKMVDLVRQGKIREISDVRDETDLSGLKITIDLKRATDPEKLMQKLFKLTPLEDSFSCNFNILVGTMPKVMGVSEILGEWVKFRTGCVRRRVEHELLKKQEKMHLLKGLEKILLDIDKAVKIVRETEEENEVIPNLMIGFGIDEIQAEYVAEIKLRQLNREYILKRTNEISALEKDILELSDTLQSEKKIQNIIIKDLKDVIKKYGRPRKSLIIYVDDIPEYNEEEEIPDYPINIFFTKEGYFKKIVPQSLRMSSEHKLKENDEIITHVESTNTVEILFFTNKGQVYKSRASEFDDTKASVLGDYIPSKLGMEDGETPICMITTSDYSGHLLFVFENGKVSKIPLNAYSTKTKRKKLLKAYSQVSPLIEIIHVRADTEVIMSSSAGRTLIVQTALISEKLKKDSIGISVMTLKKSHTVLSAKLYVQDMLTNAHRFMAKSLPAAGAIMKESDYGEQLTF